MGLSEKKTASLFFTPIFTPGQRNNFPIVSMLEYLYAEFMYTRRGMCKILIEKNRFVAIK
jgi:hypothetical protein